MMLADASRWDRFLDLVAALQAPWPQGDADTDEYRKGRALEIFNLALPVCVDLHELKPTGITWVPHILLFIVPRQMVSLGDPARRSCDACESFGAMVKKIIKHATCRRRCGTVPAPLLHPSTPDTYVPLCLACLYCMFLSLPLASGCPSCRYLITIRRRQQAPPHVVGSRPSPSVTCSKHLPALVCGSPSAMGKKMLSICSALTISWCQRGRLAKLSCLRLKEKSKTSRSLSR